MLKLNLFLGSRKRIGRRVKEANNNNLTIISNNCAQEQYNTPRCFYPLQATGEYLQPSVIWHGLDYLAMGIFNPKAFQYNHVEGQTLRNIGFCPKLTRGGLKWRRERHRIRLGQGCDGCDKTQAEHKEPCRRHSKNS